MALTIQPVKVSSNSIATIQNAQLPGQYAHPHTKPIQTICKIKYSSFLRMMDSLGATNFASLQDFLLVKAPESSQLQ